MRRQFFSEDDKIKAQLELLYQFLYHLPYYALLLDENRRIVASNEKILIDNNLTDIRELFGKGPGDVFQCENAEELGCGNIPNCRFCGIFKTLAQCHEQKIVVSNSCKLIVSKDSFVKAYEFMVRCSPINFSGLSFFLLTLTDVSAESRKRSLENIFFHDVLNMVNGLKGLALFMDESMKPEEMSKYISTLSTITERLCETIITQRDLINAEKRELNVNLSQVSAKEIIESVIENSLFGSSQSIKKIQISENSSDFSISTDPVLLSRVLINMVKNACEAPNNKLDVTIGCSETNGTGVFFVHNHTFIEEQSAKCVFQPMFSTKGSDRGLGTYSMRLIGENYLRGKVWFKTHPETGTTFTIELPINLK